MWKGRAVNVLAGMKPLTEMAIARVHVVMQVWTMRSTGQLALSGNVCNLPLQHERWVAELPRRPEQCKMLLIDRRTPTAGRKKGKALKPFRTSYEDVLLALRAAYEFNVRYKQGFKVAHRYSPQNDEGIAIYPIRADGCWVEVDVEEDWVWVGLAPRFRFSKRI